MSYNVALINGVGKICSVPRHTEGGTYTVGGNDHAELSVTYNYAGWFRVLDPGGAGLCWLNDQRSGDTISRLESAIAALGTERSQDYWEATRGNAGWALSVLLSWARMFPDARWSVE